MVHATTHKYSGLDCARCGLPLTEYEVAIAYCAGCGSSEKVLDCDEGD
jgi:ribosomal protein L37E